MYLVFELNTSGDCNDIRSTALDSEQLTLRLARASKPNETELVGLPVTTLNISCEQSTDPVSTQATCRWF